MPQIGATSTHHHMEAKLDHGRFRRSASSNRWPYSGSKNARSSSSIQCGRSGRAAHRRDSAQRSLYSVRARSEACFVITACVVRFFMITARNCKRDALRETHAWKLRADNHQLEYTSTRHHNLHMRRRRRRRRRRPSLSLRTAVLPSRSAGTKAGGKCDTRSTSSHDSQRGREGCVPRLRQYRRVARLLIMKSTKHCKFCAPCLPSCFKRRRTIEVRMRVAHRCCCTLPLHAAAHAAASAAASGGLRTAGA